MASTTNAARSPAVKRLLVFRFGQIGDTVAAVPSLWALRKHFPGARILLLSETPAHRSYMPPETVLPESGLVDGFERYAGGASLRNFFSARSAIRRLCRQGYDTLVYLVPSGRTRKQRLRDMLFFRLCGVRQILAAKGFAGRLHPRDEAGKLAVKPKEADALLARLERDGIPIPAAGEGCMDLRVTDQEQRQVESWWQKQKSRPEKQAWIAVCPGAKWASKRWPLEQYAALGRRLFQAQRLLPVVVGGSEDREAAQYLIQQWGAGLCSAGELTVRESAALLAGARFYVGNDTGVMHLAAAMKRPCVGIFSAQDWPGIWEPYGKGHKIIRLAVECAGCQLKECNRQLECLNHIGVDQVYQACREVLGEAGE